MLRRSKANRLKKQAELIVAHDPAAKREAKADGLTVGKRVRYNFEGHGRYGTVKEMHLRSVVIQQSSGKLLKEPTWVLENEVPFDAIKEVLGDGDPIVRKAPKVRVGLLGPPRRESGYEECDIGRCSEKPVKVYMVRKVTWDEAHQFADLGPPRPVAVCRSHDEPYIESRGEGKDRQDAHFPLLWQMGVVFDEFVIPQEEKVADSEEAVGPQGTNSPGFEFCWCGLNYGHRGFHRKKDGGEE